MRNELRGVNDQIEAAERHLSGRDLELAGAIRITTTDTLARGLLMPHLAAFRALHSAIQLKLVINNSFLSLTKREADVAVRPSNRPPQHLIGRRVGRIRTAIYAAKDYLKKTKKTKDWAKHDWVAPDETLSHLAQAKWIKRCIPENRVVARKDGLIGMLDAVRCGMGLPVMSACERRQRFDSNG